MDSVDWTTLEGYYGATPEQFERELRQPHLRGMAKYYEGIDPRWAAIYREELAWSLKNFGGAK